MTAPHTPEPAEEAPHPRLVVEFAAPGSADITLSGLGSVTPGQLMTAAYFLDLVAREARQVTLQANAKAAQRRGLVIPMPGPNDRRS